MEPSDLSTLMVPSWFDARTWIGVSKPVLSRAAYLPVLSSFLLEVLGVLIGFQADLSAIRGTRKENCSLTMCYNNAYRPVYKPGVD